MVRRTLRVIDAVMSPRVILACGIGLLAALAILHYDVVQLDDRVRGIEDDLNLGSPQTTQSFRETVLSTMSSLRAQVEANSIQIQANGQLIRSLADRLLPTQRPTPNPTPDIVDFP